MKKTILVIEDEHLTLTNIVNFLEAEGFDAIGAGNGRLGIQLAHSHLPDLIICDILMPELDGYDVLTQLQQEPKTAAIPFIFLTATTDKASFRNGIEMGADDYLCKPITSAELREAIANRLKKREAKIQSNFPRPQQIKELQQQQLQQLQEFIKSKNLLFENLFTGLRRHISKIDKEIELLKHSSTEQERDSNLEHLQQEFARVLALVNQVSELQRILTPENINLLNQFKFLNLEPKNDRELRTN